MKTRKATACISMFISKHIKNIELLNSRETFGESSKWFMQQVSIKMDHSENKRFAIKPLSTSYLFKNRKFPNLLL